MHENLIDAEHPDGMPVAYSYIRMSRPEQLRGDSLRRQLEAARKWAAERGVELDEGLRDIGVSAYKGKNRTEGALAGFLALVEAGKIARGSFLVMESLDRLTREAVIDALPRFLDLINAGVTVVTLTDRQEYSRERISKDWTPLMMSLAVMARAHEESDTKATRLREVWAKKRREAGTTVMTARLPGWLRKVDGKVEEIPERAELVRRIFRETIEGDGRRTIVRRLNDAQPPVPVFGAGKKASKGWQPSYVAKLLSSRAVFGEFQAYSRDKGGVRRAVGDPVPGYYPVTVSEKDFHRANTASKSRLAAPGPRGEAVTNIFLGLAKCASCGASMVVQNRGASKGGRFLTCSDADRSVGCHNRRGWGLAKVEAAVIKEMRRVDLPSPVPTPNAAVGVVEGLEGQLADATLRRQRLLTLVEDGDEEAVARVRSLKRQIDEFKVSLAKARQDVLADASLPTYGEQLDRIRQLGEALKTAKGEELREIRTRLAQALRQALVRIDFGPDTVTCRLRIEKVRFAVAISQGRHADGVPVIAIDERPRGEMTEWDIVPFQPEPGEREHKARELERFLAMAEASEASEAEIA